jgi:DNA invertase Pin-like site-specific DNA recombinase
MSPEQKAQMSARMLGKKQSAELVEKRVAPLRGRKRNPEDMRKTAKGLRVCSDEQVMQIRALHEQGKTQRQIAAMFGVSQHAIGCVIRHEGYAYGDV